MNKNTTVTCIAIIAIIIPFAYSAMNIYAAEHIQYRWGGQGEFSF
ncbi:MAG: thr operon leader peptide, partial [Nitrosopumilales archaeon CG15_BIG_FIL_POST_REV_8_21_14_020_37_12]